MPVQRQLTVNDYLFAALISTCIALNVTCIYLEFIVQIINKKNADKNFNGTNKKTPILRCHYSVINTVSSYKTLHRQQHEQ